MLLMIYLFNLWFTYDLLMIYLWNGEGGCAYHTYGNYHPLISLMSTYVYLCYLFYLCQVLITCYTFTTYDLLMNYLWFTSEMDEWGVLIILTKNTIYLFYLWKLKFNYSTYDISYTYVTYTWNAAAFGDSDDEDLNDAAEHGENMEGGGGEISNEAGTYNMDYPIHVSYLSLL